MENFLLNVLASVVAAIIMLFATKKYLSKIYKTIITFKDQIKLILIAAIIVFIVFATAPRVADFVWQTRGNFKDKEIAHLQDRIDRYLRGNYSNYFERGWRIEVVRTKPFLFLAFSYPQQDIESLSLPHPFNNLKVKQSIEELTINEGYPSPPQYGFIGHSISEEEFLKLRR